MLALVAVVGIAVAEAATTTTTVRIVARVNEENGRTEFGLQQLESGVAWGERILPHSRFFPENAKPGRWLSSTPVAVEADFNVFDCYESATDFFSCHDMEELSDLTRLEWDTQGISSEEYYIRYFTELCVPSYAGVIRSGGYTPEGGPGTGPIKPHFLGWTLEDFTRIAEGTINDGSGMEFGNNSYSIWRTGESLTLYAVSESASSSWHTVFFFCPPRTHS